MTSLLNKFLSAIGTDLNPNDQLYVIRDPDGTPTDGRAAISRILAAFLMRFRAATGTGLLYTNGTTGEVVTIGSGLTLSSGTLFANSNSSNKLTEDRYYYIRTDGSDSNTGLEDDPAQAFRTPLKAWQTYSALDLNGFTCFLNFGSGSFTFGINDTANNKGVGNGSLVISGSNTVFVPNGNASHTLQLWDYHHPITLQGTITFGFASMTSADHACLDIRGSVVRLRANITFSIRPDGISATVRHFRVRPGGLVLYDDSSRTVTIDHASTGGGTLYHYSTEGNGQVLAARNSSYTIALSGTPPFTVFAIARDNSTIRLRDASTTNITFTGSATGKRFEQQGSAFIDTFGDNNFFPGSIAGTRENRTFTSLTDAPGTITAGNYLRGNSGGTALEFTAAAPGSRELLTAPRTYYVRTDGNDNNTGLVDSAGGAFLTWQKAVNVATELDSGKMDVTIQAGGSGVRTFTISNGIWIYPLRGTGHIILRGNPSDNTQVRFQTTFSGSMISVTAGASCRLESIRLSSTGEGRTIGVHGHPFSRTFIDNMNFGAMSFSSWHIYAEQSVIYFASSGYTISGGAQRHIQASSQAHINYVKDFSSNIVITANLTFQHFIRVTNNSVAIFRNVTWDTGEFTVVGTRYLVEYSSVIFTLNDSGISAGPNFFPGNTAGQVVGNSSYV